MSKQQELKEILKLYSKQDLWNRIQEKQAMIYDLEAKLAESEKKAYSRGHSQRDIANEIKLNALREDVANKEKRIVELKQQLAESEKSKESYRLQNEQHHLQLLQFYSRLGVEAFGADIHEKALETLMIMKEQLVEKEKERHEEWKTGKEWKWEWQKVNQKLEKAEQDKISFAVYELSLVNGMLTDAIIEITQNETDANKLYYLEKIAEKFAEKTGGRINELKEMK